MGKPSGEEIPEWGARRICEMSKQGVTAAAIAKTFSTSVSTVTRITNDHAYSGGGYRVPKQGAGKRDDQRWILAGPRAEHNLRAIERAWNEEEDEELLNEMHSRLVASDVLQTENNYPIGYSTLTKAMRGPLGYTGKSVRCSIRTHAAGRTTHSCRRRDASLSPTATVPLLQLSTRAIERDGAACDRWMRDMKAKYRPEQIVTIDESAADNKTRNRFAPPSPRPPPLACDCFAEPSDSPARSFLSRFLSVSP